MNWMSGISAEQPFATVARVTANVRALRSRTVQSISLLHKQFRKPCNPHRNPPGFVAGEPSIAGRALSKVIPRIDVDQCYSMRVLDPETAFDANNDPGSWKSA